MFPVQGVKLFGSSFSIPRGFRASSVIQLSPAYFGPYTSCHGDTDKMYLVIIRIAVRQGELIGRPGIYGDLDIIP